MNEQGRSYAGRLDGLVRMLLILLVLLASAFLIYIVGQEVVGPLRRHLQLTTTPPIVEQGAQATLDPVNLQLVERVRDAIEFVNITVRVIGVLVALLTIALGLAIWKTRNYAVLLLDEHFLHFKSNQVDPVLKKAQERLDNLSTEGIRVIIKASDVLFSELLQVSQEAHRDQAGSRGLPEGEVTRQLQERKKSFHPFREVAKYLLATLSRDPAVVQDACHGLLAFAGHEAVLSQADFALEHLRGLVHTWPVGSPTRYAIKDVIDEIQRRKRDAG